VRKDLVWVSSSKKDLQKFPKKIQNEAIYALDLARDGCSYDSVKALKGFLGASILEIVLKDGTGAFRVIYTAKFKSVIYVLHAFQKKSKKGIETPKQEIDILHGRLQQAKLHYESCFVRGDHS
jgi:phage-related protein